MAVFSFPLPPFQVAEGKVPLLFHDVLGGFGMKNFYEQLMEYRKEDRFADYESMTLCKCTKKLNSMSAYDFLHGFCVTFAYALSKEYGYPIVMRERQNMDKQEANVVHCWCEKDGAFIDVRGITQSFQKFWDEFEDFDSFDLEDDSILLLKFKDHSELYDYLEGDVIHNSFAPFYVQMARILLKEHPDYYQLELAA